MDIQITKSLEGTKYITPIGLFYKNWGFFFEAPQAGLEPATR